MASNVRATLIAVQTRLPALLATLEAELGVKFTVPRSGHYNPTTGTFSLKVEGGLVAADGTVAPSREAADFKDLAHLYGLNAAHLGAKVVIDSESYEVTGLRSRAPKRPVLLKRADGKVFVFPVAPVLAALMAATPRREHPTCPSCGAYRSNKAPGSVCALCGHVEPGKGD